MSNLYIIATPIGNLEDLTMRALRILREVDVVLCEDTRQTIKLLNHFSMSKPLVSYHQHSRVQKIDYIVSLLSQGKNLALVSDAGTPGISDPGGKLVSEVYRQLGNSVSIVPVPGPSAVTALLSAAGLPADRFVFLGFLPHKKGRQSLFKFIADSELTVVFYESPHRIVKALTSLTEVLESTRQISVGRELTKKFETIYYGTAQQVLNKLLLGKILGEFVVAVAGK